jgi:hypothetical protein
MRLVFEDKKKKGRIIIAWPWIPFFIGDNRPLVEKVKEDLSSMYADKPLDDKLLDEMHHSVIDSIVSRLPMKGLRQYLEAVAEVDPEAIDVAYGAEMSFPVREPK